MHRTIGASTISCLIALAGLTSVGVAGFTGMTPSVCGMLSLGCDGAKQANSGAEAKVTEVAAKEAGQCSKSGATCSKTQQVAAKEAGECANACPFETLKVSQAAYDAAVESGCEKSKTEAHVALIQAKLAAAQTELKQAEAKIVAIHTEAKEAGLCEQACFGAKTEQASAKEAAQCSKTQQVAAKEAGECSKAAGTCSKAEKVAAAAANAECAKVCPFETLKVSQAAYDAAVESGCEKSKGEAHVKLIQAKLGAANAELTKSEEVGCAQSKTEAQAKIAAIHAEAKEAGLCEKACFGEAAVQNAANTETPAHCTKTKAEKTQASALGRETPAVVGASSPFVIPAAFAPKASGGCCKNKGERAEVEATETVATR